MITLFAALAILAPTPAAETLAIRAEILHTQEGAPIKNGVVLIEDGKIKAVGTADQVTIPTGTRVLRAAVVTPGLIDARSTLGLTGIYNQQGHDQDQQDNGGAVQPELRAMDAYNPREALISYVRSYGITTVNTGHAAGSLMSGQTFVVKLHGRTPDADLVKSPSFVLATLGPGSLGRGPGTRAKQLSELRDIFRGAQRAAKAGTAKGQKADALQLVITKKIPLLVTAYTAQDIASALRLKKEFGFDMVLDGGAEATTMAAELKAAKVPVFIHPLMQRPYGEAQNVSYETPAKLQKLGISFAFTSGFEGYVPKVRVVLMEAAVAVANGLSDADALNGLTLGAAKLLGIEKRTGSLAVGKDADIALFDGDPFEYTSHCTATVIDGKVLWEGKR